MGTTSDETLREVAQLVREGKKLEARELIEMFLREHPEIADGWIAAHLTVDAIGQRISLLRRALELDPQHAYARRALEALEAEYTPLDALLDEPSPQAANQPAAAITNLSLLVLIGVAAVGLILLIIFGRAYLSGVVGAADRVPIGSTDAAETAFPSSMPTPALNETATLPITPIHPTASLLPAPYQRGTLSVLPFDIKDAEYSRSLDRLILIAEDPNQLLIIDPASLAMLTVPLSREPLILSLSVDGVKAVVAHAGLISYVDLQTLQVLKEIPARIKITDLVLAGEWIYISPAYTGRDFPLQAIEIATERTVDMPTIEGFPTFRGNTPLVLHPDGNRLYGSDNNTSDRSVVQFDVAGEVMTFRRGRDLEHGACRDLAISEDGSYVFTCGVAYSVAEVEDRKYVGELETLRGENNRFVTVVHLSTNVAAGRILAVTDEPSKFGVWEYPSLNLITWITLPPFPSEGRENPASGQFVFATANGASYVAIVHTDLGSPYFPYESGIIIGDMP